MISDDPIAIPELISKVNIHNAVTDASKNMQFLDEQERVSEPYRTILLLRLLGHRPVEILSIVRILAMNTTEGRLLTRADIAKKLGQRYVSGSPNMEIGYCLESLTKLGVLKAKKTGRRDGYSINNLDLYLSPQSIGQVFNGIAPTVDSVDLFNLIERGTFAKKKVRDITGKRVRPRPSALIESMIQAGCSFEYALTTIQRIDGSSQDIESMSELRKAVADQIEKDHSPQMSIAFLQTQPLGVSITGGRYDGRLLDSDTVEKLILRILADSGIMCIPSTVLMRIVSDFLKMVMSEEGSSIDESSVIQKLRERFVELYKTDLEDLVAQGPQNVKKAQRLLEVAGKVADVNEPERALGLVQSGLERILEALLISQHILTNGTEGSPVSLIGHLILYLGSEDDIEMSVEGLDKILLQPRQKAQEASSHLRSILDRHGLLGPLRELIVSYAKTGISQESDLKMTIRTLGKLITVTEDELKKSK